jgi:hypothetical protein
MLGLFIFKRRVRKHVPEVASPDTNTPPYLFLEPLLKDNEEKSILFIRNKG